MSQRQKFLDEIVACPNDDLPRLIYADWLEEQGDPRAEFIRVQIELAHRENWDPDFAALQSRSDTLIAQHEMQWKKELTSNATQAKRFHLYYRRGMIEQMTLSAKALSELDPAILKTTPITKVRITHANEEKLKRVLDSGILKHILGLRIKGNLSAVQTSSLLNACSSRLRRLDFSGDGSDLSSDLGTAIADAPFTKKLTGLSMIGMSISQEFFSVLADRGGLPKLELLEFGGGMSTALPYRFEDLNLKRVRRLRVGGKLRIKDCKELCHISLSKLTRLNLQGTRPPAAGLKLMLESGALKKVERVSFKNCNLSKASLAMILDTKAAKCTHLDLTNNQHVDRSFLDAIASGKSFPKLKSINVAGTNVPATAKASAFAGLPFFVGNN